VVKIEPITIQIKNFLITIFNGMLIGLLFDGYRVLRGIMTPKMLITDLGDLLFWLIATMLVFCTLIFINWGEVRVYIFIGLMIGFVLYMRLFSRYVLCLLVILWDYGQKGAAFLNTIICKPLLWSIKVLFFPLMWLYAKPGRYLLKSGHKAGKNCRQALMKRWCKPPDPEEKPPTEPPV
jgi:spore cortex biosynthesis protein YabQ